MRNTHWQLTSLPTILVMLPLVSFYAFALDLYAPLLPTITEALHSNEQSMQYTNSLFMLFCGIGQLVFGPLSDRIGRLNTLYASLTIFLIANLTCFYADTYIWLLVGRILQAIGACGSYLCCFATIRDIYHCNDESASMFSYLNIANSVSAICAPTIGSIIGNYFGWQSIFLTLGLTCTVALSIYALFAVETAPTPDKEVSLYTLIQNYTRVFMHCNYQLFTLPAAVGIGTFFAFYCISPYLYIDTMGFSNVEFGLLYGTCGLTFFIGSYLCGQCIQRLGVMNTLYIGLTAHAIGASCLLLGLTILQTNHIAFIHPSVLCMIAGASFMVGAGIGGTMAPFKDIAGTAFAMISCYKFIAAHSLGDAVMAFYDHTPYSLAIIMLTLNLISTALLNTFKHRITLDKKTPETASLTSE